MAWVEGDKRIAVLTGIAVFLTNLVWKSFNPLVHGAMVPLGILLARNVLLVFLALDAARLVAASHTPAEREQRAEPPVAQVDARPR